MLSGHEGSRLVRLYYQERHERSDIGFGFGLEIDHETRVLTL
jgi:hypothetical protein